MAERMIKVLCPTDGSRASEKSIEWAINLAKNFSNMELIFLLVAGRDVDVGDAMRRGTQVIKAAEMQQYMELGAAHDMAKKAGFDRIDCVIEHQSGNIAASIIAYAEQEKVDHIVVGSTGKTGVERLLLGSVASEVVEKAHCPVTVVR